MDKLLLYPGKTDKGVFTYLLDHEKGYLEKTASQYHPTVASYINAAKPIPGITQVLLTALGAGEWWGDNVNADWFGEDQLAHEGSDYGYKTFEYYAKMYKHHVNKDPNASYGNVLLAVYNPVYHRVELVVGIRHDRARDVVDSIEAGEYPNWSMGCLSKNSMLHMADGSEKKVSDVVSGDKIIDGTGRVGVVSYPHHHKHSGSWYTVKAIGTVDDPEPTTEEHPWLVIPHEQTNCRGNPNNKSRKMGRCFPNRDGKKGCIACPHTASYKPEWRRADELRVGDYIATPIIRGNNVKVPEWKSFLGGHFIANGFGARGRYIILTVHNDKLWIEDELKRLLPGKKIYSRPRQNSDKAVDIVVADLSVYADMVETFGRILKEKSIWSVFQWDEESKKRFLGALIDGDGGRYKDSLYISTSKRQMAQHLQFLLASVGCIASVSTIHHSPSTIVDKETTEYQVWIGSDSAGILKDYCSCGEGMEKPKMVKNLRFIHKGYLWSPILSIDVDDCEEEVYNVAIESGSYDRDSYIVNGISLHNCKIPFDVCNICGNKAPNRRHYCEHLRYSLGQIDSATGRKVYAINIRPRFFDISYVLIPADRTSRMLKKVASFAVPQGYQTTDGGIIVSSAEAADKVAEQKQAAMVKEVPTDEPPSSETVITPQQAETVLNGVMAVKSREPEIPSDVLDRVSRSGSLAEVLNTFLGMGMSPKPQEFQRIYLVNSGQQGLADKLQELGVVFDPLAGKATDEHHRMLEGSPREDLAELLMPFVPHRSYAAPVLNKRLTIMVKQANAYPMAPAPRRLDHEKVNSPSLLKTLAAGAGIYAALTARGLTSSGNSLIDLLAKYPALSAAVGVGAAYSLMRSEDKDEYVPVRGRFTPAHYSRPDTVDIYDRLERMSERPYAKTASERARGAAMAKRLLIGVPSVYLASGALQKYREHDPYREEGIVSGFLRKHPNLVSGALVADALLAAGGKGTYALAKRVPGIDGSLWKKASLMTAANIVQDDEPKPETKSASVSEYLSGSVIWPLAMGPANLPGRIVGGLFDQAAIDLGSKLIDKARKRPSTGADAKLRPSKRATTRSM